MAATEPAGEHRLVPQARATALRPALQRWRSHRARIDQVLVRTLYASGRTALGANALGALILLALLLPSRPAGWPPICVLSWLLFFVLACCARAEVLRRYQSRRNRGGAATSSRPDAGRQRPSVRATKSALRLARWAWDGSSLALAAGWAMAVTLFYPGADLPQRVGLTLLAGTLCAAQPVSRYRLYMLSAGIGFFAVGVQVALERGPHALQLAAVLMLGYLITLWIAHRYREAFRELFALQAHGGHLMRQLGREKLAAEQARAVAEETTRQRTGFITAASHDLRQPLHALGLFGHTLRDLDDLRPDARQLVDRMVQSVELLEGMFDELLDLSYLERGRFVPRPRVLALDQVYARVAPQFEPLAFDKGLGLSFRGGSLLTHCDPQGLERILRNLLSNALRHTRDGGVLVSCRRRGQQLALQVWDTGSGIEPGDLARIFDPFYQAQSKSSARGAGGGAHDGLGLGLAIARFMADALGLGLRVRSRPGRGTVFTLLLPRADSDQQQTEPTLGTLAGRRIAVAVEQPAQREAVLALLRRWQATVDDGELAGPGSAAELLIVDAPSADAAVATLVQRRVAAGRAVPAIVLLPAGQLLPKGMTQPTQCLTVAEGQTVSPTRLRALVSYLLSPVA